MPKLGLTMEGGSVVRWLKAPGDRVALDEPLVEIETDKTVTEIGSPAAGILGRILAVDGARCAVGEGLALVLADANAASPQIQIDVAGDDPRARDGSEGGGAGVVSAPATRRLAERLGVDIRRVKGTAEGGRVLPQDVQAAADSRGVDHGPVEGRQLEGIRRIIADRMTASARDVPQVTLHRPVEIDGAREWIGQRRSAGEAATLTHALVVAVVEALRLHPALNARYRDGRVFEQASVNLAIGVDTKRGLIAPVIRHAEEMAVSDLIRAVSDLTERTRGGRARPDELEDATFTITNLGGLGVHTFDPLVNPPEVGVLGVGAAHATFALVDGRPTAVEVVDLALTFDHRVLDGADGARFLEAVASGVSRLSKKGSG